MQLPACVEAVTTAGGWSGFDFGAFVASRDTLYLVASDGAGTPVTPLFLLVCSEVAHVARASGAASAAGRLDPPMRMVLDELANTAPVPVARWSSWAAGSGIQLYLVVQAWAQLVDRYGQAAANTIWQCCKVKIVYGGTSETDLCEMVERLCGSAPVRVSERRAAERPAAGPFWMQDGGERWRREEMALLPAAELRQLPRSCAVVIADHGRPVIVRTEQVRNRADVRRAQRAGLRVGLPAPAVRHVPVAEPALLDDGRAGARSWPADAGWPAEPGRPADQLAERRGRRAAAQPGGDAGHPPAAADLVRPVARPMPPVPPADLVRPVARPAPPVPPSVPARPIPPSAPAPWERRAAGGGDQ
jgi:hypothetical protein